MASHRNASLFNVSPAIKLVAVFAVAIVLQSGLGLLLAVLLTLWAGIAHRPHFLKLLRRVRLLILVLFVVTLCMTPGAALYPSWGLYPTEEGVQLAITQLLRLLGMLAAVCLLLDTTDERSLAAGSLALLQPLAAHRQWPERAVARLLLVFHYLDTAPKPKNLNDVLVLAGADLTGTPDASAPEVLTLDVEPLSARDVALMVSMLGTAFFCLALGSTT